MSAYSCASGWVMDAGDGLGLVGDLGGLVDAEPKTLRYRLLHTAARITRGQRHHWLNIPPDWPWADDLPAAFTRVMALPAPT